MTQIGVSLPPLAPKVLLADLSLLCVAVFWGASYSVAKETLAVTTVAALIFFRFAIALAVLAPTCLRELQRVARQDLHRGVVLGCILSAIFLAETVGVLFTTATNAAFLISLCIVFTPILDAAVHRRRPSSAILFCAGLSLAGTGLMVWHGGGIVFNIGDLAILAAAGLRAVMVVSTKRLFAGRAMSSSALTVIQMATVVVLSGALLIGTQGPAALVPPAGQTFWSGLMFLALFCTLAAFFIQNWAVRRTNPTRVSFLMGTEPLFGAVFAVVLLGEAMTPLSMPGAALILGGTTIGTRLSGRT